MQIKEILQLKPENQTITAKGWVRTKRGNKNVAFIALNDGSTINNIQVVADVSQFSETILRDITTGACIAVKGKLVKSQGQGQSVEIQAAEIELCAELARTRTTVEQLLAMKVGDFIDRVNGGR